MKKQVDSKWKKSGLIRKLHYFANICISYICYWLNIRPNVKERVWLFGLADDIFSNNGRAFFEYIKNIHQEIDAYWICDKDSMNRLSKFISRDKLVVRASIHNYIMAIIAEVAVYGFSDRDIAPGFYRLIKKHKTILVNVSHGFDGLKGMPSNYYTHLPADIICAASSYEMDMKIKYCGADEKKVKLTGFARFDNWKVSNINNRTHVLIMPTWRDWYEKEGLEWKNTYLFSSYTELFKRLNEIVEKKDIVVKYNFHPRMSMFYKNAGWDGFCNIYEAKPNESIDELLEWADILITDYSSIFWDALYMNKRVILFWFDENEYAGKRGLMVDHSFYSEIFSSAEEVARVIEKFNFKDDNKNYSSKYFNWKDAKNCERIYYEIDKALEG